MEECIKTLNPIQTENTVVICPPAELIGKFHNFRHHLGAQNCATANFGAFTGESSAAILHELGCEYVIVGHSERRNLLGETNEIIFKKWNTACENNLVPILCVGEKENAEKTLTAQLEFFCSRNSKNTIIAYEPVWSIGTGVTPTMEKIDATLRFIKKLVGRSSRLLYGGSVNRNNIGEILQLPNIDGVLIGGASLNIPEFAKMVEGV